MTAPATPRPRLVRPDEGDALWFLGPLVTVKATGADTGGRATFLCDGQELAAGPGDFVLLPAGLAHTFLVGPDEPLRTLQITTPSGFEQFAAAVGGPADERRLPDPGPVDPAAMAHAAAMHGVEILGPPPLPAR